jgi:hypothetical protein
MRITMFRSLAVGPLFLLLSLFLLRAASQGQPAKDTPLLQRTVSVGMVDVYASQVLEFLAEKYRIPAGIEIVSSRRTKKVPDKKITIMLHQSPLETVLDTIVQADPSYRWEVNGGVVNLLPKDKDDSLVNIEVKSFQINNLSRLEAKRAIGDLPEVVSKLKSLGLEPAAISLWPGRDKRDRLRLSLSLRNTTLRDILNEIAKKTNFWAASVFGDIFLIQI